MRVLIASPLKEDKEDLEKFFRMIDRFEYDRTKLSFLFIVDYDDENLPIIECWCEGKFATIKRVKPDKTEHKCIRLAKLRNEIFDFLNDIDYVLWIDGDINDLPSGTIKQLIKSDFEVIAPLLVDCNGTVIFSLGDIPYESTKSYSYNRHPMAIELSEIIEADWVFGAHCVDAKLYREHICYSSNGNIEEHKFFCSNARRRGYRVGIDTSIRATHKIPRVGKK